VFGSSPAPGPTAAEAPRNIQRLWRDPLLRIAFLVVGLLLAYQLAVTLLQFPWERPATDWLRAVLAWPALLGVVLLSIWCTRTGQRVARSWWLMSGALLCYTLARNLWTVEDQFVFPYHVPFPSLPDLFFLLQYPFFFLALLLAPRVHPRIQRARVVLDACLLMGAAFALSWFFLLAPIYMNSRESLPGKLVNLSYPVGDLTVLFGLTMIWLQARQSWVERVVVAFLIASIVCLVVADSWVASLLLNTSSYQTGSPPDLFWLAFYLLVPLAGLVRFRVAQQAPAGASQPPTNLRWKDFLASLRFISPIAAVLLACVVLILQVELGGTSVLPRPVPLLIVLGLLVLALVRQAFTVADSERVRREREEGLREARAQMEAFLGVAGHELKNPLACMKLCLQVVEQRIQRKAGAVPEAERLLQPLAQAERQEERLDRLVDDLLDVSRVQKGKLDLHLAPTDLAAIVREVVEELRQVYPERTLLLVFREDLRVPVLADAYRLGQVVTNYLTNALKYSAADRSVAVDLAAEAQEARVEVRDEGPGIPAREQERIWEPYYRVGGIEVQSGTGVGLGLGLPICRAIIERHQGQVGVKSAPGQGSTFWFSLPQAPQELAFEGCREDASAGSPGDGGQQS
jgi:signal transduction histidine kinase